MTDDGRRKYFGADKVQLFVLSDDGTDLIALHVDEFGNLKTNSQVTLNGDVFVSDVDLSAGTLAALELIGIKGEDGSTIASDTNPLPVYIPGGSSGLATENTLDLIKVAVQAIDANTDDVEAKLDALNALLTSIDGKDFATETTLAAFKAEAKSESDATQAILSTLLTESTFQTEVDATQAKLDSVIANQNPTDKFSIAETDTLPLVKYYGFTDRNGDWYILKEDKTTAPYPYRYANASNNGGVPDFETATTGAWDSRESLTYDYFHNLTW